MTFYKEELTMDFIQGDTIQFKSNLACKYFLKISSFKSEGLIVKHKKRKENII